LKRRGGRKEECRITRGGGVGGEGYLSFVPILKKSFLDFSKLENRMMASSISQHESAIID